ncbi:MAG: hypothetical protein H0T45_15510, partial [Pyrinomonadaceae bacterium]|nr:hypothetical protein [Pyrinomonadaceae bacterium]
MLKKGLIMLAVLAVALLTATDRSRAGEEPLGEELREEFHQTYPLSPGGRVSLANINGAVRIVGWDQSKVKIDAVKRAHTRERLDEAKIEVDASADGISIRTRYPRQNMNYERGSRRNPASVDYTLSVPRGARLESVELINGALEIENLTGEVNASAINGRVVARSLAGEVKLSTINGPLEATFTKLSGEKITLNSVNGPVSLVIPSNASADIRAHTIHGSITNNLGLPVRGVGPPARRGHYVGSNLAGRLGDGSGSQIRLNNVNGGISILHAGDNRPLSPVTNLLGDMRVGGDDEASSEEQIQREVEREVEREMRAAQREIEQGMREAAREIQQHQRETQQHGREMQQQHEREAARAREQAGRDRQRLERDRQRSERDRQREQAQLTRDVAEAQREAQQAVRESAQVAREIEQAMTQVERELNVRDGHYGDKRYVVRETKNFTISGTPRVRLETFDGSVSVKAWERPEVLVNIIKRAGDEASLRD